ncbi:MAG TPA: PfkB family carbohydrate kinase, partial [Solirubrobacteraceae bacterium]
LAEEAREALTTEILPRATVVTPNVAEARVLAGEGELEAVARRIHALGPGTVVITGGHRDTATDLLFDGTDLHAIPGERHPDGAAHGSGCTHSSVLAAQLALGDTPLEAARAARRIAADAVRHGLRDIGEGPGPVDALRIGERAPARVIGSPRGLA